MMVYELLDIHNNGVPRSSLQGRLKTEINTKFSDRLEQVQYAVRVNKSIAKGGLVGYIEGLARAPLTSLNCKIGNAGSNGSKKAQIGKARRRILALTRLRS